MVDESIQSKGGKARAKSLTAEERSEIARRGALERWGVPKAEFGSPDRPLKIGNLEIPCYVLDNGKRVLVQAGMLKSLNMSQGTGSKSAGGGDRLAKFISGKRLKPFVSNELSDLIKNPIKFTVPRGGPVAYGYEATVLADLCDAVLEARGKGALQRHQHDHIAKQCEILVRGFARVGIIALVDEATGYQEVRDREALQAILDRYITDEWAKWTKTFPDEFYRQLFRLKEIPFPPSAGRKPRYVGHWTNEIIYKRLAPGVLKELRTKNPRLASGNRQKKHHQFLTRDFGHPALKELLTNVIFLMRGCNTWNDFKRMLERAAPKYGDTIPMDLDDVG